MKERILAIEHLRGIAAVAVLLAHWADEHHNVFKELAAHLPVLVGSWGVDLFFVVSGIVSVFITRHAPRSLDTARVFILRRIARIVPGYWFSILCITLIVSVVTYSPEAVEGFGGWQSTLLLMLQGSLPSLFFYHYVFFPINPVGWTLNIEMFFYLIFVVGILISSARFRPWVVASLIVGLIVWHQLSEPSGYLAYMTRPLMIEFCFGVVLGYFVCVWHDAGRPVVAWTRVLLLLGVLLLAGICIALEQKQILPYRWLLWGGPATLIIIGAIMGWRDNVLLSWQWSLRLGALSYSIYLMHMPTFYLINFSTKALGIPELHAMWIFTILGLPLTLFIAHLVYKYIEQPSGKYLKKHWRL